MNHPTKAAFVAQPELPPSEALSSSPIIEAASSGRGAAAWLGNAVPTLFVLAALGALGFWGHHTGWTMPKFSTLTRSSGDTPDDWCKEHGVPESVCIACNTGRAQAVDISANTITVSIRKEGKSQEKTFEIAKDARVTVNGENETLSDISPGTAVWWVLGADNQVVEINTIINYGWCKVHGVHNCPFEHPEVAQVTPTPKFTEADLARAERALKLMDRPANGKGCTYHENLVQFASKDAFEKLGIRLAAVGPSRMTEAITANGAELTYDQTHFARLSSRAAGTVWRVDKNVGEEVREGQVLALIDSAEVGRARAAYVQALVKVDLKSKLLAHLQAAESAVQGRRLTETEAELREARVDLLNAQQALANLGLPLSAEELAEGRPEKVAERVRFLGMPTDVRRTLKPETATGTLLPLRAPLKGKIVTRGIVAGEVIDTARVLFTVADTSRMWLMLDLRVEESKFAQIGQKVVFRPDGHHQDVLGKVTWIDAAVDEKTRTVKVRAELASPPQDQPDIRLHAHMWGIGRIILREEKEALVVPDEAIHNEGCCWIVFVADKEFYKPGKPKVFHVRKVRLGAQDKGNTEIIAGLVPDEIVAARNSGVLRSQLLKNNLGAG